MNNNGNFFYPCSVMKTNTNSFITFTICLILVAWNFLHCNFIHMTFISNLNCF